MLNKKLVKRVLNLQIVYFQIFNLLSYLKQSKKRKTILDVPGNKPDFPHQCRRIRNFVERGDFFSGGGK